MIQLKVFSPLRTNRDSAPKRKPGIVAGLIASIILQEKNTLRPQSTAVYSGAIRSAYLTEKAASVDGLFQRQAGYWPVSDLKWPKLILLVALFEQRAGTWLKKMQA